MPNLKPFTLHRIRLWRETYHAIDQAPDLQAAYAALVGRAEALFEMILEQQQRPAAAAREELHPPVVTADD